MAMNKTAGLLSQLNDILASYSPAVKQASEMGDQDTSHPSKAVDDQTQDAAEGSRSSENSADVAKALGALSVDKATENKEQEVATNTMGTKAAPTGEAPEVEDAFKSNKEDPGTTSAMSADDGKKYATHDRQKLAALANDINANLAVLAKQAQAGTTNPTKATTPAAGAKSGKVTTPVKAAEQTDVNKSYFEAGQKAAADMLSLINHEKQAAAKAQDAQQLELLQSVIKQAEVDAENLVGFLKASAEDATGEEEKPEKKEESAEDTGKEEASESHEESESPAKEKVEEAATGSAPPSAPGAATPTSAEPAAGLESLIAAPDAAAPMQDAGSQLTPEEIAQIAQLIASLGVDPEQLASIDPAELEAAATQVGGGGAVDPGAGALGGAPAGALI